MQVIHEESKDDSQGVIQLIDEEFQRLKEREAAEIKSDETDPGEIENKDDLIDDDQVFYLVKDSNLLQMLTLPNPSLEESCIRKGITNFDVAQRLFSIDEIAED